MKVSGESKLNRFGMDHLDFNEAKQGKPLAIMFLPY